MVFACSLFSGKTVHFSLAIYNMFGSLRDNLFHAAESVISRSILSFRTLK